MEAMPRVLLDLMPLAAAMLPQLLQQELTLVTTPHTAQDMAMGIARASDL
jgi:hypothetical protein